MTVLDYIIIALFASSAIAGLFSGFLRGVCSLVTWILALWGGWHYGHLIEPYLGGDLADPPFSTWAGSTLVFLTVLFVGAAISAILGYLVRLSLFRGMDRFLGLLFGMARGVVIVGVLAIVLFRSVSSRGDTLCAASLASSDAARSISSFMTH